MVAMFYSTLQGIWNSLLAVLSRTLFLLTLNLSINNIDHFSQFDLKMDNILDIFHELLTVLSDSLF